MKTGEELGKTAAARSPKVRGWLVPSLQLRIRIQHFRPLGIRTPIRIQILIQGFDDQKFKIVYKGKIFNIFDQTFIFTYPLDLHKGRTLYKLQKEAFSPQKRISGTTKHEISMLFPTWVIFALLDPDPDPHSQCKSGSSRPKSMRVHADQRVHNTGCNTQFGLELNVNFTGSPNCFRGEAIL
jgi:hypothetical protein